MIGLDDFFLFRCFRRVGKGAAGIFAVGRSRRAFSGGGRLLARRTLRKNGRVLMGEQQPTGRPLHPDAREKCAGVSRAFADSRDDGELPVIARLHVVVLGVAHGRARRGVTQKLRARQGLRRIHWSR